MRCPAGEFDGEGRRWIPGGGNPAIGYPWVGFGSTSSSNWERFGVGETHNFAQSGHTFSVERNSDQMNNSKWFTVSINS